MAEYICGDGRMSVNGICPASSYPGYQKPAENNTTPAVINTNQNDGDGKENNFITQKTDYSKDVKSNFQWDFDKVGNKIQNFGNTIKSNIGAYDKYVEENLGISKKISSGLRVASSGIGAATYGALGAVAPFTIPFIAGGALNDKQKKENERITQATIKDNQGDISTIDMATYGMPTYGEVGFNIHNDAGDQGNNNQSTSGGASYDNAASTGAKDGFGYGL